MHAWFRIRKENDSLKKKEATTKRKIGVNTRLAYILDVVVDHLKK